MTALRISSPNASIKRPFVEPSSLVTMILVTRLIRKTFLGSPRRTDRAILPDPGDGCLRPASLTIARPIHNGAAMARSTANERPTGRIQMIIGSFNQDRSGQSGSSVPASRMRSPLHGASAGCGPGAGRMRFPVLPPGAGL